MQTTTGFKADAGVKRRKRRSILFVCLCLMVLSLTASCGGLEALPGDKTDYAGFWSGPTIALSISPDASIEYERVSGGNRNSVSGSIARFEDDDFYVWLFIDILFEVQEPPREVDGEMRMTLYDEEIVRR